MDSKVSTEVSTKWTRRFPPSGPEGIHRSVTVAPSEQARRGAYTDSWDRLNLGGEGGGKIWVAPRGTKVIELPALFPKRLEEVYSGHSQ